MDFSLTKEKIDLIYQFSDLHEHDGDPIKNTGVFIFLDVLGWKEKIKDERDLYTYYMLIRQLNCDIFTYGRRVDVNIYEYVHTIALSDSIVIIIDTCISPAFIFNILSNFIVKALENGIMFRGAISQGKYITNKLHTSFIGQAFYEAHKYSEATEWAGIVITNSMQEYLMEKNTYNDIEQLKIIRYDCIPYKKDVEKLNNNLLFVPYIEIDIFSKRIKKNIDYSDYRNSYQILMKEQKEKMENMEKLFKYLSDNY